MNKPLEMQIKHLESRVANLERKQSITSDIFAKPRYSVSQRPLSSAEKIRNRYADSNESPARDASKRLPLGQASKAGDQNSYLVSRIDQLEAQLHNEISTRSETKQQLSMLQNELDNMRQNVTNNSKQVEQLRNRFQLDMDQLSSRVEEMNRFFEKEIEQLRRKLERKQIFSSLDSDLDTSPTSKQYMVKTPANNMGPSSNFAKAELNQLNKLFGEDFRTAQVKIQQLEDAVDELRARGDLEEFGFRKLCREVAQDISSRLGEQKVRVSPANHSAEATLKMILCELEAQRVTGLTDRFESVRQYVKSEVRSVRQLQQEELHGLSETVHSVKRSLDSLSRQFNGDRMEVQTVLTAEIRSRRDKETQLQVQLNKMSRTIDYLLSYSQNVRDSRWKTTMKPDQQIQPSTSSRLARTNLSDTNYLQEQLDKLASELNSKINSNAIELKSQKDFLQKADRTLDELEYRCTETANQVSILHSELVCLHTSVPKFTMAKETPEKQQQYSMHSSAVRKLAESLMTVKMALTIKLSLLERQNKEEHRAFEVQIENLRNQLKSTQN